MKKRWNLYHMKVSKRHKTSFLLEEDEGIKWSLYVEKEK